VLIEFGKLKISQKVRFFFKTALVFREKEVDKFMDTIFFSKNTPYDYKITSMNITW